MSLAVAVEEWPNSRMVEQLESSTSTGLAVEGSVSGQA